MSGKESLRTFFAVPLAGVAGAAGAGVALEGAARAFLDSPAAPPGRWRVVPAERIHVTLKFLGDTDPSLLPALGEALREAGRGVGPAEIVFGGWLLLPSPRAPQVLAVRVSDPTGTLSRMASALEERAAALGFPRENRPFLAHVTVARPKGRVRAGRDGGGRKGRRPMVRRSEGQRPEVQRPDGEVADGGGVAVPPPASEEAGRTGIRRPATPSVGEAGSDDRIAVQRIGRVVLYRSTRGPGGLVYEILEEAGLVN